MTTQQIADRLVALLREGNFNGVYNELFHNEQRCEIFSYASSPLIRSN